MNFDCLVDLLEIFLFKIFEFKYLLRSCFRMIMSSSDPDVLFLIDGEVGVEVNHLWCSVRWSGVPCNL